MGRTSGNNRMSVRRFPAPGPHSERNGRDRYHGTCRDPTRVPYPHEERSLPDDPKPLAAATPESRIDRAAPAGKTSEQAGDAAPAGGTAAPRGPAGPSYPPV